MVGGVKYIFRKDGDTSNYDCVDNCIYEKMEEPGTLFCMAAGDLEVICNSASPNPGNYEPFSYLYLYLVCGWVVLWLP